MRNLILALLFISSITKAQTSDSTISKVKIGNLTCKNIIRLSNGKVIKKMAFISFYNSAYSSIKDLGTIGLFDKLTLTSLISDLEKSIPLLGIHGKTSTFTNDSYRIDIMEDSNDVYLSNTEGKHNYLIKEDINTLIEWLKIVQI